MRVAYRSLLCFFILFVGYNSLATGQELIIDEDFEENNLYDWRGDTDDFKIIAKGLNRLLQLEGNDKDGGESAITRPSTAAYGEWEALIKMGTNPSSSNFLRLYLLAASSNIKEHPNGYYLEIGSSDDDIKLYRRDWNSRKLLIDGRDNLVNSDSVHVRIKITRTITGKWKLLADSIGKHNFISLGNAIDNTYATSHSMGLYASYTKTKYDKFYFDDIKVTKEVPPLKVKQIESDNNQTVEIVFNMAIEPNTVTTNSFSIDNGIGSPSKVDVQDNRIFLEYSKQLPGNYYALTISDIKDQNGNAISPNTVTEFTLFDSFAPGDVIINEFMYDEPNDQEEYIEIKNRSDKLLNIKDWRIGDDSRLRIISNTNIPFEAGEFLVFSSDTTTLFNQYGSRSFLQLSNLPSLNNGGDAIRLLTNNDQIVDSLSYTSSWGEKGVALERRSGSVTSTYSENWGNSLNPKGGTPGRPNEVDHDKQPPEMAELSIIGNQTIELGFSERLNESSATDIAHYHLSDIPINTVRSIAPDNVILALGRPLQNATSYTVKLSGISDVFGNAAVDDTTFTYYEVSKPDSGDVFINEFSYDPPDGQTEYIELYNPTNRSFDLQGWTYADNRSAPAVITHKPVILPPDSFAVLAPDSTLLSDHPEILFISMGTNFHALNNSGDAIVIRDSTGVLLDSLQYSRSWGGNRTALERHITALSGSFKENWDASPHPSGGTPGAPNQVKNDEKPPNLTKIATPSDHQVSLTFNERLDGTSFEADNYQVSGLQIQKVTNSTPGQVLLTLSDALENAHSYSILISNISDIFGNNREQIDTTITYLQESAADSGAVFISEFMYNPPEGNPEYVELYNPSEKTFNLKSWTINDDTGKGHSIIDQSYLLPPDHFVVLSADSSLLAKYPDISAIIMGSRLPILNNGRDAIAIHDSTGLLLDSLTYTSRWGGSGMALERLSYDIPANYSVNWGPPEDNLGSPGLPNTVSPDKRPPSLESLMIADKQSLQLIFSERIRFPTLEGSFSLSNNVGIRNYYFHPPDTIHLRLQSKLENASSYRLESAAIADIFGNKASIDTTFTYFEITSADSGDVFINEFSYNPPDGQTEYIELYNPTNRSFDLQGWTYADNRSTPAVITHKPVILPPDSFAVLAPDSTLLSDHPEILFISMGTNFHALNNSGDAIVIRDSTGALLDSLQYTADWGGKKAALERKTTKISGGYSENWGDAPKETESPGSSNNIAIDNDPPALFKINIVDSTTIKLKFSERICRQSAGTLSNYRISPNRNIQKVIVQSDSIRLFLSDPLASEQNYSLIVSGISDIFGNQSASIEKSITYIQTGIAQANDLVINEIMINPGSGMPVFIELYNPSNKNIDLSGWSFGNSSSNTTIPGHHILKADEYLLLTGSSSGKLPTQNTVSIPGFPYLRKTEEALYITDRSDAIIDSLYYNPSWWPDGTKHASLERKDPKAASNDPTNWTPNNSNAKNSAGKQNKSYQKDTSPPSVIYAKINSDNRLEVYFDEFITITDELQFAVKDVPLKIHSFTPAQGNYILLKETSKLPLASSSSISINNLSDLRGNITTNSAIPIAFTAQEGDLVINEIMSNPISNSNENKPNQSEYIELYNNQDYAISLEGLSIHDAPAADSSAHRLQPVSTKAKWVDSGETALIYADNNQRFDKSRTANYFNLNNHVQHAIMRVNRSSLSLKNSGDAIYIADSTGATIDSVQYSDEWHNPNLLDTRGVALERITPQGSSSQPSNWSSSINSKGGTPLAQNSIYQEETETPQEVGINLEPNPFSPDNDGYEDHLIISYKLDQPDYLLRVNIYDRYGRHIKKLADGKTAGFEGQLIWDGLRDDDRHNRIGIYIVTFEAIDSASGRDHAFKKTVVIARKLN